MDPPGQIAPGTVLFADIVIFRCCSCNHIVSILRDLIVASELGLVIVRGRVAAIGANNAGSVCDWCFRTNYSFVVIDEWRRHLPKNYPLSRGRISKLLVVSSMVVT